eukprot:TRINITY_DN22681_c1_g2_i1.p1 TRINITY_DN22681_c1_g2~~TRINITY_DN22681_c1_g2_i1.p1  ORF type:complete len:471 (-),score=34.36 TRINITY_DN22681_c1_g2_i1:252-1664(-)
MIWDSRSRSHSEWSDIEKSTDSYFSTHTSCGGCTASPSHSTGRAARLNWYEMTFEDDSTEPSSSDVSDRISCATSSLSTPRGTGYLLRDHAVNFENADYGTNQAMPARNASVSVASSADSLEPRDTPRDVESILSDDMALLSVGSALHHQGRCVPCKFMKSRIGCTLGLRCDFCHYPHEDTNSVMRRRRRLAKRQIDRLVQGMCTTLPSHLECREENEKTLEDDSTESLVSDRISCTNSPLSTPRGTSWLLRDDSRDEKITSGTDQTAHHASVTVGPLADGCDPHNTLDGSKDDGAGLLSVGSALHSQGSCIPCKFINAKNGCKVGFDCDFCHHPHDDTDGVVRRRRRMAKKQLVRLAHGASTESPSRIECCGAKLSWYEMTFEDDDIESLLLDTLSCTISPLTTPCEKISSLQDDGKDENATSGTGQCAPLADGCEPHSNHDEDAGTTSRRRRRRAKKQPASAQLADAD